MLFQFTMCYRNAVYKDNIMCSSIVEGWITLSKFIITPKEDKSVTMTIRIDAALQEAYNQLAEQTNRSRNELIGMALQYALDNMELKDKE